MEVPGPTMLNIVYALLIEDAGALASPAEVRERIDAIFDDVPLDEIDPDTWGMTEDQERDMIAWSSALPPPPDPGMAH